MAYAPWAWASVFALLTALSRLITNRILQSTLRGVPKWASAIYIVGLTGVIVSFFWSMFAIAWWACLPVGGIYGLTCLIPSVAQQALRDPRLAHLAAIQQATEELQAMPPGDQKMNAVMQRADQIMHTSGWTPK